MDGAAEDGGLAYAGDVPHGVEELRGVGQAIWMREVPGGLASGRRLELRHSAERDKFGEIDVADAAAALGLVHVMGGDEERDALAGEAEKQVPESAAGNGIDAAQWARRGTPPQASE